jgi:Fis family transcriptional regulator
MQKTSHEFEAFLEKWLDQSIRRCVEDMDGRQNGRLHELIVHGVEKPLLELVLRRTKGNQVQASNILGINRNTLRKKIRDYKIKCK